jgi:hypothetical protein
MKPKISRKTLTNAVDYTQGLVANSITVQEEVIVW